MSVLGIIALVTGTLGVWLTIKQNIWCWLFALIAVVTSIVEFYQVHLYGDMALQIFYFFAGVYGWIYWNKKKDEAFVIKRIDPKSIPSLLFITAMQAITYYYLLIYFGGDKPVFDAILTAASLTTTFMMTKKWLENWALWVVIDASYIVLYGIKGMWLFAVLNLVFTLIAFYGWLKWKKDLS